MADRIQPYNKIIVREDEAAALMSVSAKTLGVWRKAAEGPPCFLKGKFWFYPIRTLEAWAASQVS
jgi:hypothetical protein